jgi:hypothetical protein
MATIKDDPPHPETLNIKILQDSLQIVGKPQKKGGNTNMQD